MNCNKFASAHPPKAGDYAQNNYNHVVFFCQFPQNNNSLVKLYKKNAFSFAAGEERRTAKGISVPKSCISMENMVKFIG